MILEKVKEIVAEQLGISQDSILPDSLIVEDLGADSLDVIELLMALEEEYGISIPDEEINQVKTIKQIVDLIEKNRK